ILRTRAREQTASVSSRIQTSPAGGSGPGPWTPGRPLSVRGLTLNFSCQHFGAKSRTTGAKGDCTLARLGKSRRTPAQQLASCARQSRGATGARRASVKSRKRNPGWRRRLDIDPQTKPTEPDRFARDEAPARLEAVLFLAREPLNTRKLAQFAHLADGTEARTLIRRLNHLYDETASAFRAEEVAGGFQLLSRAKFNTWLRR